MKTKDISVYEELLYSMQTSHVSIPQLTLQNLTVLKRICFVLDTFLNGNKIELQENPGKQTV